MSFMVTSQTKSNRRRCIKAISENTIIAMVVNGFMIRSLLFHKVVNIAYLFPFVLHSFQKYITGASFRKKEEKLLGQFLVNKIIAIIVYFKDRAS